MNTAKWPRERWIAWWAKRAARSALAERGKQRRAWVASELHKAHAEARGRTVCVRSVKVAVASIIPGRVRGKVLSLERASVAVCAFLRWGARP